MTVGPAYYLDDRNGRIANFLDRSKAQRIRVGTDWRWKVIDWGCEPQHPDRWCRAAYFCRRENGISPQPRHAALSTLRGAH